MRAIAQWRGVLGGHTRALAALAHEISFVYYFTWRWAALGSARNCTVVRGVLGGVAHALAALAHLQGRTRTRAPCLSRPVTARNISIADLAPPRQVARCARRV